MDLFSQLTEHLLHRILYFLPAKEAARTSVLCKSWKSAWDSRSAVDLDSKDFGPNYEDKFPEFMTKTLESYVHRGLGVEKLTLGFKQNHEISVPVKQWIDFVFAPGNNLRELKIAALYFPLSLHASNTLITLDFYGFKFENINEGIKFPSLQNLTLTMTRLNSDVIHKTFLSGSPLLKSLSLNSCHGLESLEVSGLSMITSISINICLNLKRVDIKAANLQDFMLTGFLLKPSPCEINLAACEKSLKKLKLEKIQLPNNYWFETMVSTFVCLELLDLRRVDSADLEAIDISSPSLRELVINDCKSFNEETRIFAPNLCTVKFMDYTYPLYTLPASNKLSRVQLSFRLEQHSHDALWLHKLEQLFVKTSHIKGMRMTILCEQYWDNYQKFMIVHEDSNYLLLKNMIHDLKHCLNHAFGVTIKSFLSCEDWEYCLSEASSCQAIYIASSSSNNNNFLKEFHENQCNWKSTRTCCQYESLNLEECINIGRENSTRNAALSKLYQALSYKLTKITL